MALKELPRFGSAFIFQFMHRNPTKPNQRRVGLLRALTIALALLALTPSTFAASTFSRPKLVVMLVIDQFRADYLMRFESRFKPAMSGDEVGGFRYLLSKGAYYPLGQYDLLQCMTAPGHATILTGAYPYMTGIPINSWYDATAKQRTYCVEDRATQTLGAVPKNAWAGTSPKNLVANTLGDELKLEGYPSKVVSIALKDRAAILMGGHKADLSLWMDQESFAWASSKHYFPDGKLPGWILELNKKLAANKGKEGTWKSDDTGGTGLSIPGPFSHTFKQGEHSFEFPYAVQLTVDAAEAAISEMKLGQNPKGAPDLLAVSFSSHDYMGHDHGPNSREMEELTVAEDRAVSQLLNTLRKKVPGGLKNVLIAFTADHGIPPIPEWLQGQKILAGKLDEKAITQTLNEKLTQTFGKPASESWISWGGELNYYINRDSLTASKKERSQVEEVIRSALLDLPGTFKVVTQTDYQQRRLPPGIFENQFLNSYFPGRSGDAIIIPKPYFINKSDTTAHLSGYTYDRTVPILFVGAGVKPGKYATRAEVVDIAPTLAYLIGILPPNMSHGRVLSEAMSPAANP